MNKFEKQLEKWNKGVLRGAQAKLARTLRVSTATTALWATGKRRPSKGYAEQMALLFGMDAFDVYKLFDHRSVVYPDATAPAARTLREKHSNVCAYRAAEKKRTANHETNEQSNSVQLPFLNSVPEDFRRYDESEVLEWWTVPRRFAQGATCILRAADVGVEKAGPEDLCLVKPSSDTPPGRLVLFRTPGGVHFCRRISRASSQTDKRRAGQPLGVVLKLITQL